MTFRPTNRNIKEIIPMPEQAGLVGSWYVDDIEYDGTPMTYRSETCAFRIMTDRGKFIVCSPHGYYARHPKQRNGFKGRTMRFKTTSAAGFEAERLHAVEYGDA